jgi:hypothetical protein
MALATESRTYCACSTVRKTVISSFEGVTIWRVVIDWPQA